MFIPKQNSKPHEPISFFLNEELRSNLFWEPWLKLEEANSDGSV